MRRRLLVLSNPGAGHTLSRRIDDTVRELGKAGAVVTRASAGFRELGAAAREAAQSGAYDAIVAAGGDGTIRHAAAALIGTGVPLGIIPTGTGNVLAHEIGLAPDPAAIARMLTTGPVIEAACARANGEPFLLMAGAGFDARVLTGLDHRAKSLLGKLAYARPMLRAMWQPLDALTITVDGRATQASWAIVANACHYAGGFKLARTHIRERGMEAILFKAKSRGRLLSMLASLARGKLDDHAGRGEIERIACSRVSISTANSVPVQIDGDVVGTTPLEIESGADHVLLIVPGEVPPRR